MRFLNSINIKIMLCLAGPRQESCEALLLNMEDMACGNGIVFRQSCLTSRVKHVFYEDRYFGVGIRIVFPAQTL